MLRQPVSVTYSTVRDTSTSRECAISPKTKKNMAKETRDETPAKKKGKLSSPACEDGRTALAVIQALHTQHA